jgi:hypothetical protein
MIGLTTVRNLMRGPAIRYRTPDDLRRRYRHLYEAELYPTPDGGAIFHEARLWRRRGINALRVRGDRFEMAFQHGRLLREEIQRGTLAHVGMMARHGIRNSIGDGALSRVVQWYADKALAEPMLRRGLARARERGDREAINEGHGLAEGSGLPLKTVLRAPLGPEVAQVLLGRSSGLAVGASDPNHCTSFTAWGERTRGGELIIGRNTDYPLTGYYDAHPTVIYFEPTDGAQRFMGVTSAGCHNASAGGMNEAGLYLCTHTVPACTVDEEQFPVLMVGQQVLREARTLDEAADLIMEARPAAGWNFHVVSSRERKAMTFELSSAHVATTPCEGEWHVTTNHYRQPEMEPHHLFVNQTVETDTRARLDRCYEMMAEADGELDAATAAAILGDKYDRTVDRVRCGPNTVSASTTVSSSVWLPDSGKVYVANGLAPVSQNDYVELPTVTAFDEHTFADDDYEVIAQDRFRRSHASMLEAEVLYQRAREAFEYDNDADTATDRMLEAVAVDGTNPGLWLHCALYALRAGRTDVARRAVDEMLAADWDPQRHRVARYLRGRLAAHDGDAGAARAYLTTVVGDPEAGPRLVAAARKTLGKLERRRRVELGAHELSPMSWMPDAFRYLGVF